jgi:hypothetical protein
MVMPARPPQLPRTINLPVTLCSIGTTVYALGAIYKGSGEERYWSNHQVCTRANYVGEAACRLYTTLGVPPHT